MDNNSFNGKTEYEMLDIERQYIKLLLEGLENRKLGHGSSWSFYCRVPEKLKNGTCVARCFVWKFEIVENKLNMSLISNTSEDNAYCRSLIEMLAKKMGNDYYYKWYTKFKDISGAQISIDLGIQEQRQIISSILKDYIKNFGKIQRCYTKIQSEQIKNEIMTRLKSEKLDSLYSWKAIYQNNEILFRAYRDKLTIICKKTISEREIKSICFLANGLYTKSGKGEFLVDIKFTKKELVKYLKNATIVAYNEKGSTCEFSIQELKLWYFNRPNNATLLFLPSYGLKLIEGQRSAVESEPVIPLITSSRYFRSTLQSETNQMRQNSLACQLMRNLLMFQIGQPLVAPQSRQPETKQFLLTPQMGRAVAVPRTEQPQTTPQMSQITTTQIEQFLSLPQTSDTPSVLLQICSSRTIQIASHGCESEATDKPQPVAKTTPVGPESTTSLALETSKQPSLSRPGTLLLSELCVNAFHGNSEEGQAEHRSESQGKQLQSNKQVEELEDRLSQSAKTIKQQKAELEESRRIMADLQQELQDTKASQAAQSDAICEVENKYLQEVLPQKNEAKILEAKIERLEKELKYYQKLQLDAKKIAESKKRIAELEEQLRMEQGKKGGLKGQDRENKGCFWMATELVHSVPMIQKLNSKQEEKPKEMRTQSAYVKRPGSSLKKFERSKSIPSRQIY